MKLPFTFIAEQSSLNGNWVGKSRGLGVMNLGVMNHDTCECMADTIVLGVMNLDTDLGLNLA